jgi:hypothetical protein
MKFNFKYLIIFTILPNAVLVLLYHYVFQKNEPEEAAIEYCKCLQENDVYHKELVATTFCEGKLASKYYLYRYMHIDIRYEAHYPVNDSIAREAMKFEEQFTYYTVLHCCSEVHRCQQKEDLMKKGGW